MKMYYINDYNNIISDILNEEESYDMNKYTLQSLIKDKILNKKETSFLKAVYFIIKTEEMPFLDMYTVKINDMYYIRMSVYELRTLIINYPQHPFVQECIKVAVPKLPEEFMCDLNVQPSGITVKNKYDVIQKPDCINSILFYSDLAALNKEIYETISIGKFMDEDIMNLYSVSFRLFIPTTMIDKIYDMDINPIISKRIFRYSIGTFDHNRQLTNYTDTVKYAIGKYYSMESDVCKLTDNVSMITMSTIQRVTMSCTLAQLKMLIRKFTDIDENYEIPVISSMYIFLKNYAYIKPLFDGLNVDKIYDTMYKPNKGGLK